MKNIGIVSYNINCNFTNYGSALQSWALSTSIARLGKRPVLIDYCPDVLLEANPLNPFKKMWDLDEESRWLCELSLPAIRVNYQKFDDFYTRHFNRTARKYTSSTFHCVAQDEALDGFVCGSDTIFCIDEFHGFEEAYYANYPIMRQRAVAYAASFGDAHFDEGTYPILNQRLQNFKAIGLREHAFINYVKGQVQVPILRTIDPTLLLTAEDYETLATPRMVEKAYLLLYSRRHNPEMFAYAEALASAQGLKIVDISLRADKAPYHLMAYDAGVEEFLSLVKHATCVVTNSFHGLIFAAQYSRPVTVFSREQANSKIDEVLALFRGADVPNTPIRGLEANDYPALHARLQRAREESLAFLKMELELL